MTDQSNQAPTTGGLPSLGTLNKTLRSYLRGDIALALGLVAILVVLILPMPTWLLDASLALSITFSVLILMTVLFIERPLEFSSFPSILLIATMLRLALNLASTRLILAGGHDGTDAAGQVIQAFGQFVMQGNFVIGIIVFGILVLVNFIVITKGSGRIAEVAARFTLDAMPGKQMAIDADLSAGLIDEDTARTRRKDLEDESTFFGAMDGAAKFVRGDAIAGLLIVFINVIGGIIIGVAQQEMTFGEAANNYTLLTVGDGLVSQIPSLIVSVAAGMLVSKAGISGSADKAVFGQLSAYPSALGLSSILMVSMALLPGIPMIPFLGLAGVTGGAAFMLQRRRTEVEIEIEQEAKEAAQAVPIAEEPISATLAIDSIRLELGYGLLTLMNQAEGSRLTDQIRGLRRQLAGEMGFVLPPVRIQDNLQLPATGYVVRIKEIEAGEGEILPNMLLCMDPKGDKIALPGQETTEPTFGLPAMWIDQQHREEAMFKGYTVVDPSTVITTHLTEVVKDHMAELLSYAETQKLLDEMPREHQKLVADVVPSQITIGGLQRVLQNLIGERISIRDMPGILEGVAEASAFTRNLTMITEHVRSRIARQISEANTNSQGVLPLLTLSPEWEQAFQESLIGGDDERQLSMAPTKLQEFINAVREAYERHAMMGEMPVLLTSPQIRPYVRSIIERFRPSTMVMSQNEVHPKAKIKTLGQI
ncbi:MAG TPA: flagellar biosynthesis protein FlhA [Rhodospirillaceae bacterium]|nr:flagellar biosynthesis protein FlhA [Alphaproteobacteria bacterium]OUT39669.1 MAG: flagellar biosynthesis protein FlhA [Micavibrio sp. TMED2]HCI48047.1 flagellar biosynthesis protein FlhA [Rhodospirillaceae bacterium]MAS49065.1 flagellar biosynthesis protein FlhA [Alphaproteobacteria bacterium]MAX97333.1 flagellar biosynthesis protein FlhA [Alphaproteobacteria bacterium]|tara:strand:- start:799 stop:2919 length:2121 start_codon:yes stop_codon:yes gene_type:complete